MPVQDGFEGFFNPPDVVWREGRFTLGDEYDLYDDGYTFGNRWNGWACPAFEFDVALEILSRICIRSRQSRWWFDTPSDTFFFQHEPDQPDSDVYEFTGYDIRVGEETVHVYAIGTGVWTWEEVSS